MLRRLNVSSTNNASTDDNYDDEEQTAEIDPSDALDHEDQILDQEEQVISGSDDADDSPDESSAEEDDMFGVLSNIGAPAPSAAPSLSSDDNAFALPSLQGNSFLGTRSNRPEQPSKNKSRAPRDTDEDSSDDEETSLLEWGETFRYQPAVEYLRLKRLHPKLWEGIQIAGWICDIYEPIDEQWLAEHWGGGTYRLEAVQLDKAGKTRTKDSRIVTISGIPTHFADEQGNPHRLPTNSKIIRSGSEMLIGRNRGLQKFNQRSSDYESDYTSAASAPKQPSTSAVELLRLAQASNNERREDSKSLEILRLAQNDFQSQMSQTTQMQQDLYKEMLENQRREIERMRAEQDKVVQNAQRPLSEALNLVSNRAEKESLSLKEQMSRVEQEHRDRVDSLRDELNKQFNNFMREKEDLKNAHKSQVELIIKDYSERERLLIKEHTERERIYRDNLEKSLQESTNKERILRDSIDVINKSNQDKIDQITVLYNDKIDSLTKSYNEKLDVSTRAHHDKVEDLIKIHQTRENEWRHREMELRQQAESSTTQSFGQVRVQMDSLRDNHQNQISNLQNEHQRKLGDLYKEMSSLREDSRERENNIRREYSEREQRLTAEYHKNLSDARNDYSDRLEAIKREFDQRERDRKETFERIERELKDHLTKTERELKDQLLSRERELKDRHDAKISEMLTLQTSRENELRSAHDTREKHIRDNFDEKERALRESLEARYENTIKGLQDRVDFLKSNSDDKIQQFLRDSDRKEEQLKTFLESTHRAQYSVIESERNRLRDEVIALRGELKEVKDRVNSQTDPIAKLAEIQSFKENLKTFGFLPEEEERGLSKRGRGDDEDGEEYEPKRIEPPKDFLGKIAHYGPSIAQNFLGPVLARVDSATAVANEALSAQKIELQNQAKALELQRRQLESEQVAAETAQKEAFAVSQQMQMQQRLQEKKALLDEKRRARELQQMTQRQQVPRGMQMQRVPQVVEDDFEGEEIEQPRPSVRRRASSRTAPQTQREIRQIQESTTEREDIVEASPTISQPSTQSETETEMSGYERLADFLNESINDQLPAEEVGSKIKTASMLGLIPKGLLQETLADSFEVLYSNISEVATRKGYAKLISPRGLSFCQQVYTALKK